MKINRQTYKAIAISFVTCALILTSPRDASAIQVPVPAELSGLIAQIEAQQLALQVQQTQQGATSLLNLDQINTALKGDRYYCES